jgi:hypothetical protein
MGAWNEDNTLQATGVAVLGSEQAAVDPTPLDCRVWEPCPFPKLWAVTDAQQAGHLARPVVCAR